MRILIIGCGKVGRTLAHRLVAEKHDVSVIDTNSSVLTQLGNTLDVIGYEGNGASYLTLREAGAENADLLVAATSSDELNLICCLTAHKLGTRHTVARVRTPEYADQLYFLKDDLGLSISVNPELATAQEIARNLRFPSAAKVETFVKGRVELAGFRIPEESSLAGVALSSLPQQFGTRVLICAVERDGDVFIPGGSFVLRENDILYVTGATNAIAQMFKKLRMLSDRAKEVIIAGGGRVSYYLASILERSGIRVKIIENDEERAQELIETLPGNVSVLLGDAYDHELLMEEGIRNADAFIALTGLDEGNILASMFAGDCGARKVITKVNNTNLVSLIHDDRLDSVVSPRDIAANHIVAYVRAIENASAPETGSVESLTRIAGGKAEVLEFFAPAEGSFINVPLKDLRLKKGILIACIVRGNKPLIPGGDDFIGPRDGVLVVTKDQRLTNLSDILAES